MSSFGLPPAIPESASLSENWDVAAATCVLAALKARTVSGSEYVKYPLKLWIGEVKLMVIGPPLSEATFTPECGGNSNSLSVIPAVRIMALPNDSPEYWFVRTVDRKS